jgi:NADH-quinone oxidoreductase subunit B
VDVDPGPERTPVGLGVPRIGPPGPARPLVLETVVRGRPMTLHLVDAGLACCSLEVMAAALGAPGNRAAGRLVARDGAADVLVVSGTCTDVMAPLLRRLHADLGSPRVVSFGAFSASGGPYWDSYSVTPGIEHVIPVDVVVAGCPPPPEALLQSLEVLVAGS